MNASLTDRQRRRLAVADALRRDPSLSNRQIAARSAVDDKTVAAVRRALVATAEIPQLGQTVGRDGRRRRVRIPPAATEVRSVPSSGSVFCHSSERMPELPDGCVSLTVTSPPYNVGIPYGGAAENDQRPF
ncbi:MAG: hypothetical protein ACYCW6_12325, partial [Candidatus Xenobia bacterium]